MKCGFCDKLLLNLGIQIVFPQFWKQSLTEIHTEAEN